MVFSHGVGHVVVTDSPSPPRCELGPDGPAQGQAGKPAGRFSAFSSREVEVTTLPAVVRSRGRRSAAQKDYFSGGGVWKSAPLIAAAHAARALTTDNSAPHSGHRMTSSSRS